MGQTAGRCATNQRSWSTDDIHLMRPDLMRVKRHRRRRDKSRRMKEHRRRHHRRRRSDTTSDDEEQTMSMTIPRRTSSYSVQPRQQQQPQQSYLRPSMSQQLRPPTAQSPSQMQMYAGRWGNQSSLLQSSSMRLQRPYSTPGYQYGGYPQTSWSNPFQYRFPFGYQPYRQQQQLAYGHQGYGNAGAMAAGGYGLSRTQSQSILKASGSQHAATTPLKKVLSFSHTETHTIPSRKELGLDKDD